MYCRTCCNVVVATNGSSVVCSDLSHNLKNISPCDHEEADTKMLHHVRDTSLNGSHTKQLIVLKKSSSLRFEQDHNAYILHLI